MLIRLQEGKHWLYLVCWWVPEDAIVRHVPLVFRLGGIPNPWTYSLHELAGLGDDAQLQVKVANQVCKFLRNFTIL